MQVPPVSSDIAPGAIFTPEIYFLANISSRGLAMPNPHSRVLLYQFSKLSKYMTKLLTITIVGAKTLLFLTFDF